MLAVLSHFYHCPPSEFRDMPLSDVSVFIEVMEEALER